MFNNISFVILHYTIFVSLKCQRVKEFKNKKFLIFKLKIQVRLIKGHIIIIITYKFICKYRREKGTNDVLGYGNTVWHQTPIGFFAATVYKSHTKYRKWVLATGHYILTCV